MGAGLASGSREPAGIRRCRQDRQEVQSITAHHRPTRPLLLLPLVMPSHSVPGWVRRGRTLAPLWQRRIAGRVSAAEPACPPHPTPLSPLP